MGLLHNLVRLGLFNNSLTGTLCTELGQLNTSLLTLEIQGNMLSGPIPSEMGQMNALNHLFVQDNTLSGEIPIEVQDLVFGPSFLLFNITDNVSMDGIGSFNISSTLVENGGLGGCYINSTYGQDCFQRKFLYSQTCRCDCSC